jgi:hypothetical protein
LEILVPDGARSCFSAFSRNNKFFVQENGDVLSKKGDFVFSNDNIIEVVAKVAMVINNLTGKMPEIQVSPQ